MRRAGPNPGAPPNKVCGTRPPPPAAKPPNARRAIADWRWQPVALGRCTRSRHGTGAVGKTKPDTLNINTAAPVDNGIVRGHAAAGGRRGADEADWT